MTKLSDMALYLWVICGSNSPPHPGEGQIPHSQGTTGGQMQGVAQGSVEVLDNMF